MDLCNAVHLMITNRPFWSLAGIIVMIMIMVRARNYNYNYCGAIFVIILASISEIS